MTSRVIFAVSMIATVAASAGLANRATAFDHQLPQHARAARIQAQQLHHALARQFHLSPFSSRLCEVTHEIDELACQLGSELQLCCSNQHASRLVRQLDRKVCQLNSAFRSANHRAQVGIDPPVGCTLGIEKKLAELNETVHCLKSQVLHYRPPASSLSHRHSGSHLSHRDSYIPSYGGHGGRRDPDRSFDSGFRSRQQTGAVGLSLQRGNFRISFGR